jgi:hypothetical protein
MNKNIGLKIAALTLAWLPTSCGSVYLATQANERCMDEGTPVPGCSRWIENAYWIVALVLTLAFVWGVNKLLSKRNEN